MQEQVTSVQTTTPTVNQSLSLVKNLLGTTIGAIAYLRNLFPEDNFRDTSINGLALKSLLRDYSLEADELMDWMEKGVFDALEKKYLKTMVFGVFLDPAEPDKLVEGYTFGFSYPAEDQWCITLNESEKQTFSLKTKKEIMRATTEMLRRLLVLTQTLEPLPQNASVTMKLFYYEDTTPIDYQPPFFTQSDEAKPYFFDDCPEKISIGKVESPYHMLTLSMQSVAPQNHEEDRARHQKTSKHIYEIDDGCRNGKAVRKGEDTQKIAMEIDAVDNDQVMTPPPTRARPSPAGKKRANILSNTVESGHSQDDTQELIQRLKLGPSESLLLPNAPPPSMVSLDMACDAQPELDRRDSFMIQDLANSQESIISMLQESGARPTRQRVAQMLQPALSQETRISYYKDPLAGMDIILDAPANISDETESIVVECPCLIPNDLCSLTPSLKLVKCGACNKHGHAACFGYKDGDVPSEHRCYSCRPGCAPDKLGEIAYLRLGLALVWDHGIHSRTWLSKTLGVQLPVSNQLLISLQKYGFVGKGAPWHKNKICFVATKNAETKVLREAIFSDAGFKKDFGRGDITSSGKDSASTKARDTHHSVPDSDADESEDELRSLPPKMTAKGSKVGRTWSTATTVLSMAESPVLSASMDHSMVDVIHLEIPASQMGLGCHYDMGGSQESLVISLDGQHSPKKRCKASVVKKTIAVL